MGQATADRGLNRHLLPAITVLAGIGVAVGLATAPGPLLDGALDRSGIASLIPMAGSPIGVTGRTLLALSTGGLVALTGFVARIKTALLTTTMAIADGDGEAAPVIRRADAHPDAPPRRPLRAHADLGAPLPLEDARCVAMPPVEQALPANLDQPMSMYDPAAVPAHPLEPMRAVTPLVRVEPVEVAEPARPKLVINTPVRQPAVAVAVAEVVRERVAVAPASSVEALRAPSVATLPAPRPAPRLVVETPRPVLDGRIETFELTPLVRPRVHPATVAQPKGDSIADLLARLERGSTRRPAPAPRPAEPTLDETLQRLRRLATG